VRPGSLLPHLTRGAGGNIVPTSGQILIQGRSIISQPRAARLALGVCPQFSALDAQLSVAEHLKVYGRLKGLRPGAELTANVVAVARAAGLAGYRDRAATALSGGNQRKLALAIALMGDPAVVLIDEFSSGVDARMKREMWGTLRALAADKAVVITTRAYAAV
jgi:ATP-binding cassette subfamily A (ABC1) protein 3